MDCNGLFDNNVCVILFDEYGNIWLVIFKGLSYFEFRVKWFCNFYIFEGFNYNEFNCYFFYCIEEGIYFIGGMDGFNVFWVEELMAEKVVLGILLLEIVFFGLSGDFFIMWVYGLSSLCLIVLLVVNCFL